MQKQKKAAVAKDIPMEDMMGGGDHQINVLRTSDRKMKTSRTDTEAQQTTAGRRSERDSETLDDDAKAVGFSENMTTLQCFWLVTKIATPPILGMLVYILVQLVNTYFIGNKNDPVLLGGVGMGNMLINVLCFAVTQGLNGALETLVSSAFGQKQYQSCGVFLNRGKVVNTILMVPLTILFLFSEKILIAVD